jgi:hypothetical protein
MRHRLRTLPIALTLLLGLLAAVPGASADPAPSYSLALPLTTRNMRVGPMYTVSQRFGVGLVGSYPAIPDFPGKLSDFDDITTVGFGWYSDWSAHVTPERPGGVEYVQLLKTRSWPPNWGAIDHAIDANPGATWIIGNEPDIASQDNKTPAEYAAVYHEAYTHIKGLDPTAQIAIGGVVMPSPLRLLWLDEALAAYQAKYDAEMPVDVWNTHMQILPEGLGFGCFLPVGLSTLTLEKQYDLAMNHGCEDDPPNHYYAFNADPVIFEQLLRDFRAWLAERGQRDKPLIISEYGVLFPSTYLATECNGEQTQQEVGDAKVIAFMQQTFDLMLTAKDGDTGCPSDENRLVQRWLWFSLNMPPYTCYPDNPDTPEPDDAYCDGFNGSLYGCENDCERWELTNFGRAYRDYVAAASTGALSSLPRVHVAAAAAPVERVPLPPSGLPDLTKRPPYYGQP